jgi:hypothetical protein
MNAPGNPNFRALETRLQRRFKAIFCPISKTYNASVLTFFLAS